jgi:hypothetical protein
MSRLYTSINSSKGMFNPIVNPSSDTDYVSARRFRQSEKEIIFFPKELEMFSRNGAALHIFRPNNVVPLHKCEFSCAAQKAFPSEMCNGFMAGQPGVQDLNVLSIPAPKIIRVKPLTTSSHRNTPEDDVMFEYLREPASESEDEILESITIGESTPD